MSYDAMECVMNADGLELAEFAVLMALAYHQNSKTKKCSPGYNRIAKFARCSRATVSRVLPNLQSKGLVTWNTVGNGTPHKHNEYILTLPVFAPEDQVSLGCVVAESKSQMDGDQVSLGADQVSPGADQVSQLETGTRKEQGKNKKGEQTDRTLESLSGFESMETHKHSSKVLKIWHSYVDVMASIGIKEKNAPSWLINGVIPDAISDETYRGIEAWVENNPNWEERWKELLAEVPINDFFGVSTLGSGKPWHPSLKWLFVPKHNEKDKPIGIEQVLSGKFEFRRKDVAVITTSLDEMQKQPTKQKGFECY